MCGGKWASEEKGGSPEMDGLVKWWARIFFLPSFAVQHWNLLWTTYLAPKHVHWEHFICNDAEDCYGLHISDKWLQYVH
jgi:hypothetical protein